MQIDEFIVYMQIYYHNANMINFQHVFVWTRTKHVEIDSFEYSNHTDLQ